MSTSQPSPGLPIWGPPHTLALVRRRLAEHDLDLEELELHEVAPGNEYEIGPFVVEPIRVAHSIVEATALRIATPAGNVLQKAATLTRKLKTGGGRSTSQDSFARCVAGDRLRKARGPDLRGG